MGRGFCGVRCHAFLICACNSCDHTCTVVGAAGGPLRSTSPSLKKSLRTAAGGRPTSCDCEFQRPTPLRSPRFLLKLSLLLLLHFLTRCNKVRDHNFCKSCNLDFLGNIWISFGDLSWPFTGHWIGHRSLIWTGEVKMLWERPGSWSDSIKFPYLKILENFTVQLLSCLINKKTMWVLFLWTAKYY